MFDNNDEVANNNVNEDDNGDGDGNNNKVYDDGDGNNNNNNVYDDDDVDCVVATRRGKNGDGNNKEEMLLMSRSFYFCAFVDIFVENTKFLGFRKWSIGSPKK